MTTFPSFIDKNSVLWYTAIDVRMLQAKLDNIMNSLGEKHLSWWEHKGSNECRICDLLVINQRLIDILLSRTDLDSNDLDNNQ